MIISKTQFAMILSLVPYNIRRLTAIHLLLVFPWICQRSETSLVGEIIPQ